MIKTIKIIKILRMLFTLLFATMLGFLFLPAIAAEDPILPACDEKCVLLQQETERSKYQQENQAPKNCPKTNAEAQIIPCKDN
ncbi:MAG: hypothetical protein ACKOAD_06950 [Gammaproteobacteria bacterium]